MYPVNHCPVRLSKVVTHRCRELAAAGVPEDLTCGHTRGTRSSEAVAHSDGSDNVLPCGLSERRLRCSILKI
jgi:hypothetical protein